MQSDRGFDLWIGLDGISGPAAAAGLVGVGDPHWVEGMPGEAPAIVRERAIGLLVSRYRAVVFVDGDDVLLPSRIAAARHALESHEVVGCALRIVDERGRDLGLHFGAPRGADWEELLPRHNVFGLSNSAYRSDVLRYLLPLPADCDLVDWLLATRAWALGHDLFFDEEPGMCYRQYGDNVAKVLPPFSEEDVLRATGRVAKHYRLVLDESSWRLPTGPRLRLEAARDRFRLFEAYVASDVGNRHLYVEALNALPARLVWWWAVANPELEHLWMN